MIIFVKMMLMYEKNSGMNDRYTSLGRKTKKMYEKNISFNPVLFSYHVYSGSVAHAKQQGQ